MFPDSVDGTDGRPIGVGPFDPSHRSAAWSVLGERTIRQSTMHTCVMVMVVQLSDTHLVGLEPDPGDPNSPDAGVRGTVAALGDRRPDLVLLTGDVADDGSVDGCRRLRGLVEQLGAPILATSGNHDLVASVAEVFGPSDSAEVGNWRILMVDTAIPGRDDGAVDVEALRSRLDAVDARPTLIAMHHPPVSPSTHEMFHLDGATELIEACAARPHVRGIVTGHLHEAFERTAGDVAVVGCPSSFYAIVHDGDTYRLDPDGLVGAQLLHLGDDGTLTWDRVRRLDD
jgi:Icc protein